MPGEQRVRIADIVRDLRYQLREGTNHEHVEHLANAIKCKERLPPVTLTPQMEVVDGWHRIAAHEQCDLVEIDAVFKEFESDLEARAFGVFENMRHGLHLSRTEQKAAAKALLDAGMSQVDVSRAFGEKVQRSGNAAPWIQRLANPGSKALRNRRERQRRAERALKRDKELTEDEHRQVIRDEFGLKAYSKHYNPRVAWKTRVPSNAPGTPILFISDWHYGETVNPEEVHGCNVYDYKIAERRLKHVAETAVSLLKRHLAHADYPGIVLCLGGDMISGGIHDELMQTDYPHTKGEQARQAAEILSDMVAFLADEFPQVVVYGVPGNHGRMSRKPRAKLYAHDNFDTHTYLMVERFHRGAENIEFNFPLARELNFELPGRRFLLVHGDQFRGGDGQIGPMGPVIRGAQRKQFSMQYMPQMTGHETMLCGHHHQWWAGSRVCLNGSVKGFDEFALQIGAPYEPPIQTLVTVHPTYGITWVVPIYCDPGDGDHEGTERLRGMERREKER